MLVAIDHVPIRTNPKLRESRLFRSISSYVRTQAAAIFRIYTTYEPLRVFLIAASIVGLIAFVVWGRFLILFIQGEGEGHIQSVVLGSMLFVVAVQLAALGVIGDLLANNRVLIQRNLERTRRIELQLGIEPSHYERGERRTVPRIGLPRLPRRRPQPRCRSRRELPDKPARVLHDGSRRGPDRQHVRQVRLDQPAREAAHARFRARNGRAPRRRPESIIDVGCGEGVLTEQWAAGLPNGRVVGVDLDDLKLKQEWDRRALPNLEFQVSYGDELPFAVGEFEAAAAMEVLEHVPDPDAACGDDTGRAALAARERSARARLEDAQHGAGAYLRDLGNTPGHLNHWSKRSFAAMLGRHGNVVELRSPPPWTMALVELGCRRRSRNFVRQGSDAAIGADRHHRAAHVRVPFAGRTRARCRGAGVIGVLWAAVFLTASVIYRPVEQLLSRTIAEHQAHGRPAGHALRVAATIQLGLAVAFAIVALALKDPIEDDLFSGSSTLYWCLFAAVILYAASYFARGFGRPAALASTRLVLMEATSRVVIALLLITGVFNGQNAAAVAIAVAPLLSLIVVPWALRGQVRRLAEPVTGGPDSGSDFTFAHGPASPVRSW